MWDLQTKLCRYPPPHWHISTGTLPPHRHVPTRLHVDTTRFNPAHGKPSLLACRRDTSASSQSALRSKPILDLYNEKRLQCHFLFKKNMMVGYSGHICTNSPMHLSPPSFQTGHMPVWVGGVGMLTTAKSTEFRASIRLFPNKESVHRTKSKRIGDYSDMYTEIFVHCAYGGTKLV